MTQTLKDKISESENKHFQAGWQAALNFMKNREKKINNSVSGKEDVKLPEVGKKYRANFDNMLEAEIEYISKNKEVVMSKLVNVGTKITVDENKIHSMDKFIKYFVELPEDNIEKPTEKPKSIWKDVSELPDYRNSPSTNKTYLVKLSNGTIAAAVFDFYGENYINPRFQINGDGHCSIIVQWCELTDYINNTEERLRKLEGK